MSVSLASTSMTTVAPLSVATDVVDGDGRIVDGATTVSVTVAAAESTPAPVTR